MSKTLMDIAKQLKNTDKKVQLIYAFNGTGKTRLSQEFKDLIVPKESNSDDDQEAELTKNKILYYNAFTEDLFYWDNDLEADASPKLKIQPNTFTDWILKEQGQDQNIITNFQKYTSNKLTPRFNESYKTKDKEGKEITVKEFSEVTFSLERGDDETSNNFKISKGEESNFIWSVFYTLLDLVISTLNVAEPENRETKQFDELEYVFIDDPVSSLDENHLIELAVRLSELIKSSESNLKFVITTHNPLFYNVLHNELSLNNGKKKNGCYLLNRFEDGSFSLEIKYGDSNKSFSYHLYLKETLKKAIGDDQIQKLHFMLLRNLYEKTANFLGYRHWSNLLDSAPGDKKEYLKRIIQFSSHRTLSNEEIAEPTTQEKQTVKLLLDNLIDNYGYDKQETKND